MTSNYLFDKKNKVEQSIIKNIQESLLEYIEQNAQTDSPVDIGQKFCEWALYNLFELREDEVIDASDIGGQYDNGIDAVFEINGELNVVQCKYNTAHTLDALLRFKSDSESIIVNEPITNRQIVKEMCKKIRQQQENNGRIVFYYITSSSFTYLENTQIANIDTSYPNVIIHFIDIEKMAEIIEEKKGLLPREFRNKPINLIIGKNFDTDSNTIVAMTTLKNFSNFVNTGGNYLFHSNIRNYLSKSKINQKIKETLETEPDKFWYYNNGVTIVCKEYHSNGNVITLIEPQIVNGCQTAKTIADVFSPKTLQEASKSPNGFLLVKVIRTKRSEQKEEKKELKDNITRYTNSQNAVKGLDFYALDEFQKGLQKRFERNGYYYEIQRGAYIGLDKGKRQKYKGLEEYNYLVDHSFKFVLPAKEVIQAFTAGIVQRPNIAYGNADELTPIGSKWEDVCNEYTKNLPLEHFLFPYLILKYIKTNLGYKPGIQDFRKSSALLFVSTYYCLVCEIISRITGKKFEKPDELDIEIYKIIFSNQNVNLYLLELANKILENYFEDSKIIEYVADDLKNFLKVDIAKTDPWYILIRKIKSAVDKDIKITKEITKILYE